MSTLRVDNLQASDGLSPAYATSVIAKGYFVYDQTAPAVDESENVSSISDDITGEFGVSFTNSMATAAYAVPGSASRLAADTNMRVLSPDNIDTAKLTSGCDFAAGLTSTATEEDRDGNSAAFLGDLA